MRRISTLPVLAGAVVLSAAAVLPLSAALAAPVAAQDTFIPGTGNSSASIARLTLRSSGLGIGVGLGQTRSRFAGAQGNAEADSVDMGLFNTLSKAPIACGTALGSLFPPGSMPEGLAVSSGGGPAELSSASVGAGTPVQLGSQYAAAAPNSKGDATVDGAKIDLQGIVSAVGGMASSSAKLTPGTQRTASAESGMGSLTLAGGAVVLEGMHWTATHRTGTEADSNAGFTVGSIRINGQYYPTSGADELQSALDQANSALTATGLSLHAPQVSKSDTGISITPLRLTISTTKEMRHVLGPALEGIQPIRSQLLTFVTPFGTSPDCGLAKGLGFGYLVADLALVVLGHRVRDVRQPVRVRLRPADADGPRPAGHDDARPRGRARHRPGRRRCGTGGHHPDRARPDHRRADERRPGLPVHSFRWWGMCGAPRRAGRVADLRPRGPARRRRPAPGQTRLTHRQMLQARLGSPPTRR